MKVSSNIVARLKVLAELLTYRTDIPQEGRIRGVLGGVEIRACQHVSNPFWRESRRAHVRRARTIPSGLDDFGCPPA